VVFERQDEGKSGPEERSKRNEGEEQLGKAERSGTCTEMRRGVVGMVCHQYGRAENGMCRQGEASTHQR
jgi:hypothetical protein